MIKVNLYEDFEVTKEQINRLGWEDLLEIDCKMQIEIDGKIFYDDWICPLELYKQYLEWKDKNKQVDPNFYYNTIDDAQNPVLEFFFDPAGNNWLIHSCFQNYSEGKRFTAQDIEEFFNQFKEQLFLRIK